MTKVTLPLHTIKVMSPGQHVEVEVLCQLVGMTRASMHLEVVLGDRAEALLMASLR